MQLHMHTWAIIFSIAIGFITRLIILLSDYRQYPTYPHGQVIHLALGLIAAALGAVAVPALLDKNYTAVTFLTLAAQQFRDVRNMERETLSKLDDMELVPRGNNYIEGIAKTFEGRNYLVILTSLLSSMAILLINWWIGILVGFILIFISYIYKSGQLIADIADVKEAEIHMEGPNLYVDNIYLMNIGLEDDRKQILENGLGIILEPKDLAASETIANVGQRQAILHDASTILGVVRDTGEPALVPIAKRDMKDGRLGMLLLPQEKNVKRAIELVGHVPVLESAIHKPAKFQK